MPVITPTMAFLLVAFSVGCVVAAAVITGIFWFWSRFERRHADRWLAATENPHLGDDE